MDWVRVITAGGLLLGLLEGVRSLVAGRGSRRLAIVRTQQEVLSDLHEDSTMKGRLETQIDREIESFIDSRTVLRWRWWLVIIATPTGLFGLASLGAVIFIDATEWQFWVNFVAYTGLTGVLAFKATPPRHRERIARWGLGERPLRDGSGESVDPPSAEPAST